MAARRWIWIPAAAGMACFVFLLMEWAIGETILVRVAPKPFVPPPATPSKVIAMPPPPMDSPVRPLPPPIPPLK